MVINNYIKTIKKFSRFHPLYDTWIVDDIFPVSETSLFDNKLSESGYWVKLVNFDDQVRVPVRYLLADKKLVSHTGFISDDDGLISSGRAYHVNWNYPKFKRESQFAHSNQIKNTWFLDEKTLSAVTRDLRIEEFIASDYENILNMIHGKEIPESTLLSDHEYLKNPKINLHVMNVGQGDTIVLRFPGNRIWLIDAYLHSKQYQHVICFSKFLDWLNRVYRGFIIERFIISHLHYDHIMSAQKIITTLQPNAVIFCNTPVGKTTTALELLRQASNRKILYELKGAESRTKSGFGFNLVAASNLANKANSSDQNHHGIIMDVVTRNSHLLLPGDASWDQVDEFLRSKHNTIHNLTKYYKVTHHCSYTGYNAKFLSYYSPDYAYTSCSNNNRYGHPDPITRVQLDNITYEHIITWEHRRKSIDRNIQ